LPCHFIFSFAIRRASVALKAGAGNKVTMQNLDTSAAINRLITQPDSVEIAT
jgi:hypothetical protein